MDIPLINKIPPTPCKDEGCEHSYCSILRNIAIEKAQQEEQEAYILSLQKKQENEQTQKDGL